MFRFLCTVLMATMCLCCIRLEAEDQSSTQQTQGASKVRYDSHLTINGQWVFNSSDFTIWLPDCNDGFRQDICYLGIDITGVSRAQIFDAAEMERNERNRDGWSKTGDFKYKTEFVNG